MIYIQITPNPLKFSILCAIKYKKEEWTKKNQLLISEYKNIIVYTSIKKLETFTNVLRNEQFLLFAWFFSIQVISSKIIVKNTNKPIWNSSLHFFCCYLLKSFSKKELDRHLIDVVPFLYSACIYADWNNSQYRPFVRVGACNIPVNNRFRYLNFKNEFSHLYGKLE